MEEVYGVAALQGLLLVMLLFSRKHQSKANFLMGAYLIVLVFTLTVSYLIGKGSITVMHSLQGLNVGITFLCGPFAWLYARLVTGKIVSLSIKEYLHFLPYLLFTLFAYLTFYGQSHAVKSAIMASGSESWIFNALFWTNGLKIAHSLVYYYFTYRLIRQKENWLPSVSANGNLLALKWLRLFLALITAISLVMMFWFVVYAVFGVSIFNAYLGKVINLLLFVLVYAMAWFALK